MCCEVCCEIWLWEDCDVGGCVCFGVDYDLLFKVVRVDVGYVCVGCCFEVSDYIVKEVIFWS